MSSLTNKTKIRINRDVLEKFLPDNASIRKFEELLKTLNDLIPEDLTTLLELIEESEIANTTHGSKINSINSLVQILIKAFEIVESKPDYRPNKKPQLDYIDFYENGNVSDKPGRVYWKDSDDKSLNIVMNEDGVTLQVGQEIYYLVKNTSGVTINNGQLCKFNGVVGASGKLTVTLANGSDNLNYITGIATQDILNNDFGFVTHFGLVRGFNTSGSPYSETWNDGDLLYPHPTTNGGLTNVQPEAPFFKSPIAVIINAASGGSGSVFVRMKTGEELNTLKDVEITSLSNEDILYYNLSNLRWENVALSSILPSNVLLDSDIGVTVQAYNANTVIDASYVHTDNNLTNTLKTNYDAAYTHSLVTTGNPHNVTKSDVGLSNVENTALSTWSGSTNLTTLGTIASGTWQGSVISQTYLAEDTTKVDKVSSTDNAIVRYNGTGGDVQNSSATIDDSGNVVASSFRPTGAETTQYVNLTGSPTSGNAFTGSITTSWNQGEKLLLTISLNYSSYSSGYLRIGLPSGIYPPDGSGWSAVYVNVPAHGTVTNYTFSVPLYCSNTSSGTFQLYNHNVGAAVSSNYHSSMALMRVA